MIYQFVVVIRVKYPESVKHHVISIVTIDWTHFLEYFLVRIFVATL